jgi:hypothetical protein
MGYHTKDIMEKRDGAFVFKKKDLEIGLDDGTRYIVNPEKDVCLYKIPYRPGEKGEEFYMHNTKNDGIKYYRFFL